MARLLRGQGARDKACSAVGSLGPSSLALKLSLVLLGESIACGGGSSHGVTDWVCGSGKWVQACRRVLVRGGSLPYGKYNETHEGAMQGETC
jgi:hypothetical protein